MILRNCGRQADAVQLCHGLGAGDADADWFGLGSWSAAEVPLEVKNHLEHDVGSKVRAGAPVVHALPYIYSVTGDQ